MPDYGFYAAILRFVARKTDRGDARLTAMMTVLEQCASDVEAQGGFTVPADRLEITARAFAGVAAFLQKQILPEAVANANPTGERQIRWAIDSAMDCVNRLLSQAATQENQAAEIRLNAPPV